MITDTEIKLRPKELADAQNDYLWQTDPELAGLDASPPLTMSFPQYLADYSRVLRHPSAHRRSFAIETRDGQHIGNCTYYGIDQTSGETEMGIMIGNRDYWDKGYGTRSVAVLLEHIFRQTKLKRVYLKTLESNYRAQACFLKCGFRPCGQLARDGHRFVLMEMGRRQWPAPPPKAKRG